MITAEQIQARLLEGLPGAQVRVVDTTGTFDHFDAVVVSERFAGIPRVRQHQLVYEILGKSMESEIHALALKTYTPERYARLNQG